MSVGAAIERLAIIGFMGSVGERAEFLRHRASRIRTLQRYCMLCFALFILPSPDLAQINHVEVAARFLSQGDMAQAEAEARQALRNTSTRALALATLGTIRLEEGRYGESTSFFNQALALNPHLVGARTSLGNAYALQGKPDLARKSFQEVLRVDPGNFNARFDLAKIEASTNHFRQSLDAAGPILPQLSQSDEGIVLVATDYGALEKREELKKLVANWQQIAAPSDEASLEFGNVLLTYGMPEEARNVFEAAEIRIAAHPSPATTLSLGKGYMSLGVLDRAEQNFQLALTLAPTCVLCELSLAEIAEKQGNSEKALSHLIAAKKIDSENPEILFEFGKVCLQRNLVNDALPALAKAVALKPEQDSYVYVLGSANVAKGDLPKAAALFAGLLRKRPRDAVLNYSLGAVYYLQGRYAEAESALKASLLAEPDQVAASYYLGLTYDALAQDDLAIPIFRDLLKSHSDHVPSYVKLGSILLRQHHYEEAEQNLERAVSLDPSSVEGHYQLGLLLRRLGKAEESDKHLTESRRLESARNAQTDLRLQLLLPDR
ncbi:MAG: hypothetical protein NVS9B4_13080 [Candidatus Acidiferrum sp.]